MANGLQPETSYTDLCFKLERRLKLASEVLELLWLHPETCYSDVCFRLEQRLKLASEALELVWLHPETCHSDVCFRLERRLKLASEVLELLWLHPETYYNDVCFRLEQRLKLASEALELVWLHHEIGRCYLQVGRPVKALEHGEKAAFNAQRCDDDAWLLNTHVLIAHAHGLYTFSSHTLTVSTRLHRARSQSVHVLIAYAYGQ